MKVQRNRIHRRPTNNCRVMKDLQTQIEDIERVHKITLTSKEVASLKRLLCSYVCGGSCGSVYLRPLQ